VLSLYYMEDLRLKEIALILEVSESRVSQIHTERCARSRPHAQVAQFLRTLGC